MLYFSAIILFLIPLVVLMVNNIYKIKISVGLTLLSLLFIFQVFWTFLGITNPANSYLIATVLFSFSVVIWFSSFCYFVFHSYTKNKKENINGNFNYKLNFNSENLLTGFKEYLPYFLSLMIGLMFVLFSNYFDHDAHFYINISNNFKSSMLTADGFNPLEQIYRIPAMYYVISSFFPNDVSAAFYLLNPLFVLVIGVWSSKLLVGTINFKSKNFQTVIEAIVSVSITAAIISSLNYLIGANVVIQSLLIVPILLATLKNKSFSLFHLIAISSFSFFSPTGVLIGLPLSAGIFLFLLFKGGITKNLNFIPYIIAMLILSVITFINVSATVNIILYVASLILCFAFWSSYFFLRKKYLKNDFELPVNFLQSKILFYLITFVFLITTIGSFVLWAFIFRNQFYIWQLTFLFVVLICALYGTFVFKFFSKKEIDFLFVMILAVSFVSFSEGVFVYILRDTFAAASSWRLIFLNIGMGNIADITLWSLVVLIHIAKNLNLSNNKMFLKISSINNKYVYVTGFTSLLVLPGAFSTVNLYTTVFRPEAFLSFNSNVQNNLFKISQNDIRLLRNLEFTNFQESFFTDLAISSYIDWGVDATFLFGTPQLFYNSYQWNFDNLSRSIDSWNRDFGLDSNGNPNSNFIVNTPAEISGRIRNLATNPNPITSITNERITEFKYFILSKNTTYYEASRSALLETNFNRITIGDDITIFSM